MINLSSGHRVGALAITAILAGWEAPISAQTVDCTAPRICFWVDDDTCGRCIDSTGTAPTEMTCTAHAECAGVGLGVCGGVCADDPTVSCLDHADCVGGVCKLPSIGFGTEADPYCRIQRAYDAAVQTTTPANVHTIVVQPGTYQECVTAWGFVEDANGVWDPVLSQDRPVYLVAKDFLDTGDNGSTVIDGTGKCDPTQSAGARDSAVKLGGTGARLEGFTITGAARSGVFAQGEVTITNNVITGNESELGGGVYLLTAGCYYEVNVDAVIADNRITDNHAAAPPGAALAVCQICLAPAQPCGGGDGGGIFAAVTSVASAGCATTDRVEIRGNEIRNNTAENVNRDPCTSFCENSPDPANPIVCGLLPNPLCPGNTGPCVAQVAYTANGAGLFVFTASEQDRDAVATITENLISGNSIVDTPQFTEGYGGGIYVVTFGIGRDTVSISDNCIGGEGPPGATFDEARARCTSAAGSGNSTTLHGGGISARARPFVAGLHEVEILDNMVTGNSAGCNGGGLELLTEANYLGQGLPSSHGVRLTASRNTVTGNEAGQDGGGIAAISDIRRTTSDDAAMLLLAVDSNVIQGNTSGLGAGGALLIPIADADEFSHGVCGPNAAPADSRIDFVNNLVADNFATAADPFVDVIGGGILVLPLTFGDAVATVAISQGTVTGNSIGPEGFVGGIEAEAVTYYGCLPGNRELGESRLVLDGTIVADNTCQSSPQCFGVGGPPVGGDALIATVTYSCVFGHTTNYESTLFPVDPTGTFGNISLDPAFRDPGAGDYRLLAASPAVDAGNPAPPIRLPATDLEGDPRVIDGDGDGDAIVDIGADEFSGLGRNQPPLADAGEGFTAECSATAGTPVTLDGSGSTDPDGDGLAYEWIDEHGSVVGATSIVEVTLRLGTFGFTLIVSDGKGGTDQDSLNVTVADTTPPLLSVPAPLVLGCLGPDGVPASNDEIVAWLAAARASDRCGEVVLTNDAPILFGLGKTTVSFQATDGSFNVTTRRSQVSVVCPQR